MEVLTTGALPLVSFDLHYYDTELIWSLAGLFTVIKFNSFCNILYNFIIIMIMQCMVSISGFSKLGALHALWCVGVLISL